MNKITQIIECKLDIGEVWNQLTYIYIDIYVLYICIHWHTSLRRKYFRSGTLRFEFEPDFGLYMEIYPIFACAFHTLSLRVVCQFDGSHVVIMIDVLRVYILICA